MTAPMEIVKICVWCNKPNVTVIKSDADWRAYWEWKEGGAKIQRAFWHWPPAQREALISGTHDKCFDKMFAEPEEEDSNA